MITIAICDTNKKHLQYIMQLVDEEKGDALFRLCGFDNPYDFADYLQQRGNEVDLVITDTRLGEYDGIEIAYQAQKQHPDLEVIFISGKLSTVFDSYRVRHIYFIPKPIEIRKLREALSIAVENISKRDTKYLIMSSRGMISKVNIGDVLYFESNLRVVSAHTFGGIIETYGRLEEMLPLLDYRFLQCHKSYIVNMDCIHKLENKTFALINGETIKISPKRYKISKEAYMRFITNRFEDLNTDYDWMSQFIRTKITE